MTAVSVHPKGSAFVRATIALALSKNNVMDAVGFASSRWGENSPVVRVLKAQAGATTSGSWGEDLVGDAAAAAAEFLSLVRERTVIGRLTGLRRVPAYTPILAQTGAAAASWVGEGKPMLASQMSWNRTSMKLLKVSAMAVVTDELLRSVDPAAEAFIRADLIRSVADASDLALLDPANAGEPDEKPASITNTATVSAATGPTFKDNLERLVEAFTGDLASAYLVGRPELFVQISGADYPNVGARGGEIAGIPVLATRNMPNAGGDYQLALIDPTGIVYASDDSRMEIRASSQTTIEFEAEPVQDAVEGTPSSDLVSLWQVNGAAIAAQMAENWQVSRTGSVALMTGIAPATGV